MRGILARTVPLRVFASRASVYSFFRAFGRSVVRLGLEIGDLVQVPALYRDSIVARICREYYRRIIRVVKAAGNSGQRTWRSEAYAVRARRVIRVDRRLRFFLLCFFNFTYIVIFFLFVYLIVFIAFDFSRISVSLIFRFPVNLTLLAIFDYSFNLLLLLFSVLFYFHSASLIFGRRLSASRCVPRWANCFRFVGFLLDFDFGCTAGFAVAVFTPAERLCGVCKLGVTGSV